MITYMHLHVYSKLKLLTLCLYNFCLVLSAFPCMLQTGAISININLGGDIKQIAALSTDYR